MPITRPSCPGWAWKTVLVPTALRWDAWGTLVRPNNLTNGIYRGGRRNVDLYYRIHSGINGAGMIAFGTFEAKDPRLVWDLVNWWRSMPPCWPTTPVEVKSSRWRRRPLLRLDDPGV